MNRRIEERRLELRAIALEAGAGSEEHRTAEAQFAAEIAELQREHERLAAEAGRKYINVASETLGG